MKRVTRSQDKWSEKGARKKCRTTSHVPVRDGQLHISCDYCQKDITLTTRILCAVCAEFDLCLECYSGGVELRGHKYWHEFRMIEDLRFSFLNQEWTVAEEQLLLEGLELYGIQNWSHIANYVSTKDAEQCRVHYDEYYLNSPSWPNISFDHVPDSRREHNQSNKRARCPQQARKERRAMAKSHKVVKSKTPVVPSSPAPQDLCGYMPKRDEFECEWDDLCELSIMNLEFTEDDTPEEFEEKMQALEKYNKRLDKRHAMRRFVVDKKLHDSVYQEEIRKVRTPREEKLHKEYKKYLQVIPPAELEEFVRGLAHQQELEEKVKELQDLRRAGLTNLNQVPEYKADLKKHQRKKLTSSSSRSLRASSSSSSSSTSWSASPPPSPSAYPLPLGTEDFACSAHSVPSSSPLGTRGLAEDRFYLETQTPSTPVRSRTRSRPGPGPVSVSVSENVQVSNQKRRTLENSTTLRRNYFGGLETHFPTQRNQGGAFLRGADNAFVAVI